MANIQYRMYCSKRKAAAIVKHSPFDIRTFTIHYTSTNPQINDYDTF